MYTTVLKKSANVRHCVKVLKKNENLNYFLTPSCVLQEKSILRDFLGASDFFHSV